MTFRISSKYFFGLLVFLQLLLIWIFPYFPSQDGPAHVNSARILRAYLSGDPLYRTYYDLMEPAGTNAVIPWMLAAGMSLVSPLTAEKILLSLYVMLLPSAFCYALSGLRPGNRFPAFAVFPPAYGFFLHMGFYSFCFSLVFFFFAIGWWCRHRSKSGTVSFGIFALLVTATHVMHPVTTMILLLTVFCLHFFQVPPDRREGSKILSFRPFLQMIPAAIGFIPAICLLLLFWRNKQMVLTWLPFDLHGMSTSWLRPIVAFSATELWLANLYFFLIMALLCLILIRGKGRRWLNGFLIAAFICLGLSSLSFNLRNPSFGGATFVTFRMSLFFLLSFTPWIGDAKYLSASGPRDAFHFLDVESLFCGSQGRSNPAV